LSTIDTSPNPNGTELLRLIFHPSLSKQFYSRF
jgi:hypothetical protein